MKKFTYDKSKYQRHYAAWCLATGQVPGEPFKAHEYIIWMSGKANDFNASKGMSSYARLDEQQRKELTEFVWEQAYKERRKLDESLDAMGPQQELFGLEEIAEVTHG